MTVGTHVFFQAEGGIRDLVRSRGLGDVYKRQGRTHGRQSQIVLPHDASGPSVDAGAEVGTHRESAVSYTHLTLPTSDLV